MVRRSIWENIEYNQTGVTELKYTLLKDGDEIYTGKAYAQPDSNGVKIGLNKIIEPYIRTSLVDLSTLTASTVVQQPDIIGYFQLYDSDNNVKLEDYYILNDWSYEYKYRGSNSVLSNPVNGHKMNSMLCFKTSISGDTVSTEINTNNAKALYPTLSCGKYAIYYDNSFGGYDSYLIEGNVVKTDDLKQYDYTRVSGSDYSKTRYISDITAKYECNTKFMTDEQSLNFAKNLLESNHIYFHSLCDNTIEEAVIDQKSVKYLTYRSNGMKFFTYKFNVLISKINTRR